ncbi:MAG: DUF3048 domain-containing protein [Anaerolineales bacterium]|nr:DUF3048 domain-containing protein [Anaerolineales bacterium]
MKARFTVFLLFVVILGGCSLFGGEETPVAQEQPTNTPQRRSTSTPFGPEPSPTTASATDTPTPAPTATVVISRHGPDNFPENVSPLTGLVVENQALLERRPLAVKITLMPRSSRPQWGLSLADIVFEYYQNGGISRFHTIFLSNDSEMAGPIRSARFPDEALIRMHKSIFAFGSADFRVLNRFRFADFSPYLVNEYPAGCPPMCRYEPTTHNHLVTNTPELSEYISNQGLENGRQNLNGMLFDSLVPTGGQPGTVANTRFGPQIYHRWEYDPTTGAYLRNQDVQDDLGGAGEEYGPLIDQMTDEQITAANVVVLLVPHDYFSRSPEIIEMNLAGSGDAFAFRDGQVYQVRWNVPAQDSVLYLTNPDGSLFPYKPGKTWYTIIGTSSLQSQPEDGTWRFEFRIP